MNDTSGLNRKTWIRVALFIIATTMLILVYLFQRVNVAALFGLNSGVVHPNVIFVINRVLRLTLNDLACFILIFVFFQETKYLRLAFWVFLFELLVILPVYLIVKLSTEGDSEISSPLLSQIHRLIVNPTLMILLMAGFLYQRLNTKAA